MGKPPPSKTESCSTPTVNDIDFRPCHLTCHILRKKDLLRRNCPQISTSKLEFLYSGKEKNDITMNYGLNYSDISILHRFTGESYQYMFTGVEESYAEIAEEMFSDK